MLKIDELYNTMIYFQPTLWKKLLSTAILAEKIGREFEVLSEEYIIACYYMNIGYLSISRVINDSTRLTDDDKKEVKRHPRIGSEFLEEKGLSEAAMLVYHHHEKPDGMGYYGEQKYDKRAAYLGISDAFIGQISPKPYSSSLSIKEAISNFKEIYGRSNMLDQYEIQNIEKILLDHQA